MSNAYTPSKISITGIVTAMEWDADDNVVSVKISTQDEEEYDVEDNAMADELLGLLYEPVKVTGILHESKMGKKAILVESYELLDEDEFLFDEWDEIEDEE